MKQLSFPLKFSFRITTLANDFVARDSFGNTFAFVRQNIMSLKSKVMVYTDDTKTQLTTTIEANKIIGRKTTYTYSDATGQSLGSVTRNNLSLWKSSYVVTDPQGVDEYTITEANPWIRVGDAIFKQIPIIGPMAGYIFHPRYNVTMIQNQQLVMVMKRESSFFGSEFTVEQLSPTPADDTERIVSSLMMAVLLERVRR